MPINNQFIFSQSSLQDYIDCPRRFELKYIQKLKWPAQQVLEEDDYRYFIDMGSQFHRLAHQYFIGISPEVIQSQIKDAQLFDWWEKFLSLKLDCLSAKCIPETTLGGWIAGRRVTGKYDLVVARQNKIQIYDWKTSRRTPHHADLAGRIQTKLYLLIMAEFGREYLELHDLPLDQIEMIYWFASNPDKTFRFKLDETRFKEYASYLETLIKNILHTKPGSFNLTSNHHMCKYCRYRSICDRGKQPGNWSQAKESDFEDQIDNLLESFQSELEQISETWI